MMHNTMLEAELCELVRGKLSDLELVRGEVVPLELVLFRCLPSWEVVRGEVVPLELVYCTYFIFVTFFTQPQFEA